MRAASQIQLPNGLWRGGALHHDAAVRPLTGEDEEYLIEEAAELAPACRVTALLARCVVGLGAATAVGEEDVRRLCLGDREAILLELRRISFGERIRSATYCTACGEHLDLEVQVRDLRLPNRPGPAAEWHELRLATEAGDYRIRYRLPTGADQEIAAAEGSVDEGVRALIGRCVQEAFRGEAPMSAGDLPPAIVERLSLRMAESDPQAEIQLATRCPACGHAFGVLLDMGSFLLEEIRLGLADLYREVATLALHYHWSEGEILRMTARKRRRYLELLRAAIGSEEES